MTAPQGERKEPDAKGGAFGLGVEEIAKSGVVLLGLCYLVGVVVVGVHSWRFGYYSLPLVELDYVIAGAWAIMPCLFVGAAVTLAGEPGRDLLLSGNWKQLRGKAAEQVGVAMMTTLFIGVVGAVWVRQEVGMSVADTFLFVVSSLLVVGTLGWWGWRTKQPGGFLGVAEAGFVMGVIVLYGMHFGLAVYGRIPSELGGGEAEVVELIVDRERVEALAVMGIRTRAKQRDITLPVRLIRVTKDEYVVLPGGSETAVVLRRDIVYGLRFLAGPGRVAVITDMSQ